MGVQVRPLFPVLPPKKQQRIIMDELKEKLAALGIESDKIDGVIETVLGFVKDKLPDGVSGMLDGVISGDEDGDSLLDKAKGLFGG